MLDSKITFNGEKENKDEDLYSPLTTLTFTAPKDTLESLDISIEDYDDYYAYEEEISALKIEISFPCDMPVYEHAIINLYFVNEQGEELADWEEYELSDKAFENLLELADY